MTKDVWIRITALHRRSDTGPESPDARPESPDTGPESPDVRPESPDTEPEQMALCVPGRYYFRNGKHYAEYEETDPESGETSKSRISLRGGCLEIRKTGSCRSRLIFEENRRSRGEYYTPFGILTAETDVKSLRISEDENQIEICVDYAIALNGEKTADSRVSIRITAKPVRQAG